MTPDLAARLDELLADFAEHGVTPTPLKAIAWAKPTAVALAEMIREQQEAEHA